MSAAVREAVDQRATAKGLSWSTQEYQFLRFNVDAQFIERPEAWAEVGMPCPRGQINTAKYPAQGPARNDDVLHRNIGFFKVGQQPT